MNRFLFSLFLATCVVVWVASPRISRAAVFERDWKVPGDGLLTFDDVNRREWLELTESRLAQFGAGGEEPGLSEFQYQNAVAETLPGGLFEGFRVAKSEDLVALAQSAGINTATLDFATNQSASSDLMSLLGLTFTFPNDRQTSRGFLDEFDSGVGQRVKATVLLQDPLEAGLLIDLIGGSESGVWLYRIVPEPSTICLSLTLATLLVIRCKRNGRSGKPD